MAKAKSAYRIVWRPMAEVDLDAIIDYIALDNPTQAQTFAQALRDQTLALAQHPKMGRAGRPGLPAFVRELVIHPGYIVFYRVLDEADTVEILRVRHATQQIP